MCCTEVTKGYFSREQRGKEAYPGLEAELRSLLTTYLLAGVSFLRGGGGLTEIVESADICVVQGGLRLLGARLAPLLGPRPPPPPPFLALLRESIDTLSADVKMILASTSTPERTVLQTTIILRPSTLGRRRMSKKMCRFVSYEGVGFDLDIDEYIFYYA